MNFNFYVSLRFYLFALGFIFLVPLINHAQSRIYVDVDAAGSNNGTTWTDAFTDLQAALDNAVANDEIWVAEGTYYPSKDSLGNSAPSDNRLKTFQLVSGIDIYGGFSGTENAIGERDVKANRTILDGDLTTLHAFHVVIGANNATLDGFTIRNGLATGILELNTVGGGMLIDTLSDMSIKNCTFYNNHAAQGGGIAQIYSSNTTIENCYFTADTAVNGGAIGSFGGSGTVINNCVFHSNHAYGSGETQGLGAALYVWSSGEPSVFNSTFSNNTSETSSGALHTRNGPRIFLYNCIIWGNKTNDFIASNSSPDRFVPVYCCIEQNGWEAGEGNISTDPLLADSENGYLNLLPGSSCIDAANGDYSTEFDIRGNTRIDYGNVANSGTGTPTYADIGAIEFYPTDAGIFSIDEPLEHLSYTADPRDVKLTLKNNMELTDLTSLEIGWSIDGAIQSPVSWTGTISPMGTSSPIKLGEYIFPDDTTYLKFWISQPNGEKDQNQGNDTVRRTVICRTYDIGVYELVNPVNNDPMGTNTVQIKIENFSFDSSLTSATIQYMINDVGQPAFEWTGTLPAGMVSDVFSIGTFEFPKGTNELKIWTELPNDKADENTQNDTLYASMEIGLTDPLSGTYTIGMSGLFYSFNSAVQTINDVGISGQVIFEVESGTYTEQIHIQTIEGSSDVNTVTFTAASGDSSDVVLQFDATLQEENYTLLIDNASYLNFENLTIASTGSEWESNVVRIRNGSEFITFSNNHLHTVYKGNGTAVYSDVVGIYDENNNNIVITNNLIENGNRGINASGISGAEKATNLSITNNQLFNQGMDAIKAYYYDELEITENRLLALPTSGTFTGVRVRESVGLEITKNKIIAKDMTNSAYGIYGWSTDQTAGNEALIANNVISILNDPDGTRFSNGIYLYSSDYCNIYYNSVNITGSANSKSLDIDDTNNLNVKNNLFTALSGNIVLDVDLHSSIASDHNNIFSAGDILAMWQDTECTDLSGWQAESMQDAHSVSVNPAYYSETDLHTNSFNLDNIGTPVAEVLSDIEGTSRDGTNPDPGAYEFSSLINNLSLIKLTSAITGCGLTSTEDVTIEVVNRGTADQTDVPVAYSTDEGVTVVSETISGILASGDTATYTFTTAADYSTPGPHSLSAIVDLASDELRMDDTIHAEPVISYGDITTFPFYEGFESGDTYFFQKESGSEAAITINAEAAKDGNFGVLFTGGFQYSPWSDGPDSTNLWVTNVNHHAEAFSCNVNVSSLTNPQLQFDLQTLNNHYADAAWFRVLVNDSEELYDISGERYFHSNLNSPYGIKVFDLTKYKGGDIKLTFQSSIKAENYNKVYLDNIAIGEPPLVDLGADVDRCEGESILLDAGEGAGYSYAWREIGSTDTVSLDQTLSVDATGTYYVDVYNPDGMIATDTINVTVNPTYLFTTIEEICNGDSLLWRGDYYKASGVYYENLTTQITGCDSIYELDLTVHPVYLYPETYEICDNDSLLWRNEFYKTEGTYYDSLFSVSGCDSVYQLNLTVHETYLYEITEEICEPDLFMWRGDTYDTTGIYYDSLTTIYGCDSVYMLNLSVHPEYYQIEQEAICSNDSIQWHNDYYKTAGTYYANYNTINGCDSIYELQLTVNPAFFYTDTKTICSNESLEWHGQDYNEAGIYYATYQTIDGCDSIYELQLNVNDAFYYTETATICSGDSIEWRDAYYHTAGTYYENNTTILGCDSIYEIQLAVADHYEFTEEQTTCKNDPLYWRGQTADSTGLYYDSLTTIYGCDSVYILVLKANEPYYGKEYAGICNGEGYEWQGATYYTTGVYTYSSTTMMGCDSILELDLTVHPRHSFTQDYEEICPGDSILWRAEYYKEQGEYFDSLTSIFGCDSIYSLMLQLHPAPVEFTIEQNNSQAYTNDPVYLFIENGDPLTTYTWDAEEGEINYSNNMNIEVIWTDAGTYAVSASGVTQEGCHSDTASLDVDVIVGTGNRDTETDKPISIHPNPTNGKVYVTYHGKVTVELFDILGQKLLISNEAEIDLSPFECGTYMIMIRNSENDLICIEKLIKR